MRLFNALLTIVTIASLGGTVNAETTKTATTGPGCGCEPTEMTIERFGTRKAEAKTIERFGTRKAPAKAERKKQ